MPEASRAFAVMESTCFAPCWCQGAGLRCSLLPAPPREGRGMKVVPFKTRRVVLLSYTKPQRLGLRVLGHLTSSRGCLSNSDTVFFLFRGSFCSRNTQPPLPSTHCPLEQSPATSYAIKAANDFHTKPCLFSLPKTPSLAIFPYTNTLHS